MLQVGLGIFILIAAVLLLLQFRLQRTTQRPPLRPLPVLLNLQREVGKAIESGSQIHITLGQGSLIEPNNPTSIAASKILDRLARDGCANGAPPLVTVGDGTLLPLAEDSLRHGFDMSDRTKQYVAGEAHFVASNNAPLAYAGGAANEILQQNVVSNVLVGHMGPELIVMADAAARQNLHQFIGTDDPTALAVATAVGNDLLIGEELLVSGAYLEETPGQIASVQLQDVLRWLLSLALLGVALFQLITGA